MPTGDLKNIVDASEQVKKVNNNARHDLCGIAGTLRTVSHLLTNEKDLDKEDIKSICSIVKISIEKIENVINKLSSE